MLRGRSANIKNVTLVITESPTEFRDRAWRFLEAHIECNALATISLAVLEGRYADVHPLFAYSVADTGTVDGAALRTPPFSLVTSELPPHAVAGFMDEWLARDPEVNGANGPPATAQALSAAWCARTGGSSSCTRRMAMHTLTEVTDPPRVPAGRLRAADRSERELLIEWWRAFEREAHLGRGDRAAANVDARLDDGDLFVWDDDGPVSLLAVSPSVARVGRIGPVYTPPEYRRRGYAGMAVAELSRRALAGGARASMLFTDLANPTSNKIYAQVGYRRIGDWEEHLFRRDQ
jgi:RimJ/RimL family protein N-acetyltransferase